MKRYPSVAFTVAVLLVAGCSDGDDTASTATVAEKASTTTEAPAATTTAPTGGSDRGAPAVAGVQPFSPEICATADAALEALAIPVSEDGRQAAIDTTLAAIDAAKASDPGYSTEVLTLLETGIEEEVDRMLKDGYDGWQEALVERRSAGDDEDLELQLENYRAYVTPRC